MNNITDLGQQAGTNILLGASDSGKTKVMIAIIYEKLYYKLVDQIIIFCLEDSINYYTDIFYHPILQKKISIIPFESEETCLENIQKLKKDQLIYKQNKIKRRCVVVFDDIVPYMRTKESESVFLQLASSIRHL
jgi:DNA replication protein DnaC